MSGGKPAPLVVNDWTIFAHPLFLNQVEALFQKVEGFKRKDPTGFTRKNATKRLAASARLAFDDIAQDPDDWDRLLAGARAKADRLQQVAAQAAPAQS